MKTYLLFLFAFLSLVLAEESADRKLQLLCKDRSVDLTRSSQVRAIIEALKASPQDVGCSEAVKESILALSQVIDVDNEAVCSMSKVEQLRDYHFRYISTVEGRSAIPKSLRDFVIGFGLTVSKQCKKLMINSLMLDTQQVTPADYKVLEPWYSGKDAILSNLGGGVRDFDDLLSIRNLLKTTGQSNRDEKVFVYSSAGGVLSKVQSICGRKFKPFYEKLILPLVELSNFGYNYQGEELQRELAELTTNEQVQSWYKITYLCESLGDLDLVQDPEDALKSRTNSNGKMVRILTKEEAEEFKKNGGISLTEQSSQKGGETLVYTPENYNLIDDKIIERSDRNMIKLINNFDSQIRETDKVRLRLFHRLANFIKKMLLKGRISLMSTILDKLGVKRSNAGEAALSEDLVKVVDDYVEEASDRSKDNPVGISVESYGQRVQQESKFRFFSPSEHRPAGGSGFLMIIVMIVLSIFCVTLFS